VKALWSRYQAWWGTQPARVRWLLLIAAPAAVLGLFDSLVWTGQQRELSRQKQRVEAAEREAGALETAAAAARVAKEAAVARDAAAREELLKLDTALRAATANAIPPAQMSDRLALLMQRVGGAAPIGLVSEPPQPLAGGDLFRHPFVLRVEGDYAALLDAIRAIEKDLPPLQWRGVEFQATEHPLVRGRFDVFTLSGQSVWIRL
jgi:hypothetical protein